MSPPPATLTNPPALVIIAAVKAHEEVLSSKGGISNTPRGPFQSIVLDAFTTCAKLASVLGAYDPTGSQDLAPIIIGQTGAPTKSTDRARARRSSIT